MGRHDAGPRRRAATDFDVRDFGATGDGRTIDSPAINRAIAAAAVQGGGIVRLPAGGTYACFSIRLRSNVELVIEAGATLLAAQPKPGAGYDAPEPNSPNDRFEDFGHSHWHNSLIWGENLRHVTILGPGRIYGFGLSRGHPGAWRAATPRERAAGQRGPAAPLAVTGPSGPFGYPSPSDSLPDGIGDKSIALKDCRNVVLRDLTIYHGGHFGILATGDDNLTIDNLTIDTDRDGMDIDSCRNVRISDCAVNSPFDDGICLKSDHALGRNRACENIAITNCHVSGFEEGTLLSGRDIRGPRPGTGRIKFGTESNGGFKNVVISNCTFDDCDGLAIEEVDGGSLENVAITNLTMRDIGNSAIYIRLGSRNRGPAGTRTGTLRRVTISDVVATNVDPRYSSIISGIPGHSIEDLTLADIRILYRGGGTAAQARIEPPELENDYPEPARQGVVPAYGFFIRHARNIVFHDIDLGTKRTDARPPFVLEDVQGADFHDIRAAHEFGRPTFVLHHVTGFAARAVAGLPDVNDPAEIAEGNF
ncbi:MAG: rhamnogalacturonidase [Opitutaceae bacterium]